MLGFDGFNQVGVEGLWDPGHHKQLGVLLLVEIGD